MNNEPKAMRETHAIRLKNFVVEKDLTPDELEAKRKADIPRTEEIIEKCGLKVATPNQ